jgi:hypothetical protein
MTMDEIREVMNQLKVQLQRLGEVKGVKREVYYLNKLTRGYSLKTYGPPEDATSNQYEWTRDVAALVDGLAKYRVDPYVQVSFTMELNRARPVVRIMVRRLR